MRERQKALRPILVGRHEKNPLYKHDHNLSLEFPNAGLEGQSGHMKDTARISDWQD
jgi:hypothetical protein